MKKVLFVASVEAHLTGFHVPYLQYFKDKGYEVCTAARGTNEIPCVDKHYSIPFERSPFKLKNIGCYSKLKKLINNEKFNVIHCHTPVASVLTRLAARKARRSGTVVVYTAHGFHFYKGAPKVAKQIFLTIEKWLSRFVDYLLTINQEDYEAIVKYKLRPGKYFKIHGVGVDTTRFVQQSDENKKACRQMNSIPDRSFVLIFAAEYCENKNQKMLFEAVRILKNKVPDVLLLLPGDGVLRSEYEKDIMAMGIDENVRLLGYRKDMETLLLTADAAVSSSKREGLPINIVEAMAVSLPVVATAVRGHIDLVKDADSGFLVPVNDAEAMAGKLTFLYENPDKAHDMRQHALEAVKPYLLNHVILEMETVYDQIIHDSINRT